ncbi:hypothetical protein [Bergeyella zoohelcum]|uniref:Uncharacterized protein n=1 Tax=Bergeyella zoohelcum TaxID=1015 RepID=A0A376C061_9FLAO|nr:hypothetical protein [Bergeyella zoohelcum]EKB60790.1 hypothetical protein HMPREF9700_00285 [Bergeyella zoohelcum CCUG 30536]SSZ47119.1 Uncharacterised protein [Bergeyella zoohelcum]
MEDYKELMKDLLLRYYSVEGEGKKLHRSTFDIFKMCHGIIPTHPITEHDAYEVMQELGFQIEQKIIYEKVCIFEGDEEAGVPSEYDEVETERIFLWVLYEK